MSGQSVQNLLDQAKDTFDNAAKFDRKNNIIEAQRGYSCYLYLLDELEKKDDYMQNREAFESYLMTEERSVTEERVRHLMKNLCISSQLKEELITFRKDGLHGGSYEETYYQDQDDSFGEVEYDNQNEFEEDEDPLPDPPPPLSAKHQYSRQDLNSQHDDSHPGPSPYNFPPPPLPVHQEHSSEISPLRSFSSPPRQKATPSRQMYSRDDGVSATSQSDDAFSSTLTKSGPVQTKLSRGTKGNDVIGKTKQIPNQERSRDHRLDQKTREVVEKVLQEPRSQDELKCLGKPKGRIVVTGCKGFTNDTLWDYFESPRKGWGVVESITRNPSDDDIVNITFPSPQAADIILRYENHQIEGRRLTVCEYIPPEEVTENTDTICVRKYGDLHDDTLRLYFESHRSCGGEIADITRNQSEMVVYIKFKDPKVAERVVLKETHTFQNEDLVVTTYTEENQEAVGNTNTIAVKGYGNLSDDTLQMFFENRRIGGPVLEIKRDKCDETVYITFENQEDVVKVMQKEEHKFSNQILYVFIPVVQNKKPESLPDTVVVTGYGDLTDDTLQIYFENHTKDGEIKDFWRTDAGVCISFKSPDDVERILEKRRHTIQDCELEVTRYSITTNGMSEATISVSGYGNLSDEILTMYFERPKNMGGDIQHLERDDHDEQVTITFEDPKVAASVLAKKDHRIDGFLLKVVPYKPQNEEQFSASVEIKGGKKLSDDTIQMYFENRRSGGGEVKKIWRSQNVVYITFVNTEDAKNVSEKKDHVLEGHKLEVTELKKQPTTKKKNSTQPDLEDDDKGVYVLQVKGVPESMTKDTLELFFENRRKSGGGDIEATELDRNTGTALIYFNKGDVVERVVQRAPLRHEGTNLEVSAYLPQKTSKSSNTAWLKEHSEGTVLEVGGCSNMSKDTLTLYFENKKRSGGVVKDVLRSNNDDVFYLVYESTEEAKAVSSKQHTVDARDLHTKIFKPPVIYDDRFCVSGLPENTTETDIITFFETKTSWDVREVTLSEDCEKAIVIVDVADKKLDVGSIVNTCNKRPLKGAFLDITEIPVSKCIQVQGICPSTTEDMLRLYFESRRSGNDAGLEVDDVELEEENALVRFRDHEVIDKILRRKHRVDNTSIKVISYNECLGNGGNCNSSSFHVPSSVTVNKLNKHKVKYIKQSEEDSMALNQQLSDVSCKVSWSSDDSAELNCTLTTRGNDASKISKSWKRDAVSEFNNVLSRFAATEIQVLSGIWPEVKSEVMSKMGSDRHKFDIYTDEDSFTIVVAGETRAVETAELHVKEIVNTCTQEKDRKKTEVSETIPLKEHSLRLKLLLMTEFPQKIMLQFKGIKVVTDLEACTITFTGQISDVTAAKLKMYETTQTFSSLTLTTLPETKIQMIKKRDVEDYIVEKLKEEKLAGVWEVDENGDGKVHVLAQTSEDVHKVGQVLKSSVGEQFRDLDHESVALVSTKEWKTFVETLVKENGDTVKIEVKDPDEKLHILVTDNIKNYVVEEVNNFISNRTQYREMVKFPKGVQRFLTKYADKEIQTMALKHSSQGVNVLFKEDSLEFLLNGTKDGLEATKRQLDVLADKVKHRTHLFNKPGIAKLLLSDRGDQHIMNIENTERCIIEREVDGEEMTMYGRKNLSNCMSSGSGKPMTLATVDLGNERTLYVVIGDITQMRVDAIVNAANSKLEHIGGLAGAIVREGGQSIQDECKAIIESEGDIMPGEATFTQPGDLPCKIVIHAIGPLWSGGLQGEEDILHEAVMRSLETANTQGYASIAIPAISTGIYKYPVPEATRCIIKAIQDHFEGCPESHVRYVYVCDNNEKTVKEFKHAASEQIGSSKMQTGGLAEVTQLRGRSPEQNKQPAHRRRKDSQSTSLEPEEATANTRCSNIKIKIVHGELAKQKVHVLCNLADKSLDLTHGTVSKTLQEKGGSILQHECSTKYPDGIEYGEIAITQGGDLPCISVYHTCMPHWSEGTGASMVRKVIEGTLQRLSETGYTSIAYSALGVGNLGYPRTTVAKLMFDSVRDFGEKNPETSVQEVVIVLYISDIDTIKAFQAQQMKTNFAEGKSAKLRSVGGVHSLMSKPGSVREKHVEDTAENPGLSEVYQMGKITFTIKNGDITKEKSDFIVNSTNTDLNLREGAVSQAILGAGGSELSKELGLKVNHMKKHGVAVTTAKGLPAEYIIHVSGAFFRHDWKKVIMKCLKEASTISGCTSIAFPVLGTGQRQITPKAMAVLFVDAMTEFEKSLPKDDFLSDIRVIIFQKEMYAPFTEKIRQVTSGGKKGFFGKIGEYIFGASPEAVLQETVTPVPPEEPVAEVTLHFFSFDNENIEHAISKIESTYDESSMERTKIYEALKNPGTEWIERVDNLKSFGVKVEYNHRLGRVRLRGIGPDVLAAVESLQLIVLKIKEKDIENQEALMISERVQWSYIDEKNDKVSYDPLINKIIEDAFTRKLSKVSFTAEDNQHIVVDFHQMVEYPASNRTDTVAVIREELTRGESFESPSNWVPMASDCEIMPVQSGTKEFAEVNQMFYSTLGTGPPRIISKIERCQTQFLWQQYAARKKQLDKQNPGHQNEQQLWHGTDSGAIESIRKGGFNRRYSKNAKAFGEGVYFSVNASYASQNTYSAPDSQGNKYMFLARVLTGIHTEGKEGLKLPPVRDTQKNILYDSVVDKKDTPTMYVIFHDTQAYPEYLITFQ